MPHRALDQFSRRDTDLLWCREEFVHQMSALSLSLSEEIYTQGFMASGFSSRADLFPADDFQERESLSILPGVCQMVIAETRLGRSNYIYLYFFLSGSQRFVYLSINRGSDVTGRFLNKFLEIY